jgi:hypothetical protein
MTTRGEYEPECEPKGPRRLKVAEFEVGQRYMFGGQECEIESFPTRNAIVLKAVNWIPGQWSGAKTLVGSFREKAVPMSIDDKRPKP